MKRSKSSPLASFLETWWLRQMQCASHLNHHRISAGKDSMFVALFMSKIADCIDCHFSCTSLLNACDYFKYIFRGGGGSRIYAHFLQDAACDSVFGTCCATADARRLHQKVGYNRAFFAQKKRNRLRSVHVRTSSAPQCDGDAAKCVSLSTLQCRSSGLRVCGHQEPWVGQPEIVFEYYYSSKLKKRESLLECVWFRRGWNQANYKCRWLCKFWHQSAVYITRIKLNTSLI